MRTIKFRVWDTGLKSMSYNPICDKGELNIQFIKSEDSSTKIMQFTGLLDKNGKEIFEGDIVNCSFQLKDSEPKNFKNVAVDFDPIWGTTISPFEVYSLGRCRDIEVIGNIYENPELLK